MQQLQNESADREQMCTTSDQSELASFHRSQLLTFMGYWPMSLMHPTPTSPGLSIPTISGAKRLRAVAEVDVRSFTSPNKAKRNNACGDPNKQGGNFIYTAVTPAMAPIYSRTGSLLERRADIQSTGKAARNNGDPPVGTSTYFIGQKRIRWKRYNFAGLRFSTTHLIWQGQGQQRRQHGLL